MDIVTIIDNRSLAGASGMAITLNFSVRHDGLTTGEITMDEVRCYDGEEHTALQAISSNTIYPNDESISTNGGTISANDDTISANDESIYTNDDTIYPDDESICTNDDTIYPDDQRISTNEMTI
jgi:hypothetical protein